MTNEPTAATEDELWLNTGNGLAVLTRLSVDGKPYDHPVKGLRAEKFTAAERQAHSARCVRDLDPFRTGLMEPVNDAAIAAWHEQKNQGDYESPWSSSGVGSMSANPPVTGTFVPDAEREDPLTARVDAMEDVLNEIRSLLKGEAPAKSELAAPAPAPAPASGSTGPDYMLIDEATGAVQMAPAVSAPTQRAYTNKLTDAERETVATGDRASAVAILKRLDSATVVEQLRQWARDHNASNTRLELITDKLKTLDPTARSIRIVNRVNNTGAQEPGPHVVDMDALGDPEPQGLGREFSDDGPRNVTQPGEGIRDETDTTRLVPNYDSSFPPPQVIPGTMDVD